MGCHSRSGGATRNDRPASGDGAKGPLPPAPRRGGEPRPGDGGPTSRALPLDARPRASRETPRAVADGSRGEEEKVAADERRKTQIKTEGRRQSRHKKAQKSQKGSVR